MTQRQAQIEEFLSKTPAEQDAARNAPKSAELRELEDGKRWKRTRHATAQRDITKLKKGMGGMVVWSRG